MRRRVRMALALAFLVNVDQATAQLKTIETDRLRIVYPGGSESFLIPYLGKAFENSMAFQRRMFDFDPKEPQPIVQCSLKNYFLSRGYTLIVFARRGRGESTGTYVEECDLHTDQNCTPARTREMSDPAIDQGLADTSAVLDQIVLAKIAGSRTTIILAGHSRGAVLSLAIAAKRPDRIAAVINFSGGWLGVQGGPTAERENYLRAAYHHNLFAMLGRYRGPTLWLYADRDPLYGEPVTRRFFADYVAGEGRGDYFQVHDASLANGHLLVQESPLWSALADRFLMFKP